MKKILLITVIFCTGFSLATYSQICTPDPGANTNGLHPTTSNIDTGLIGSAYAQTLTMVVPTDTSLMGITGTVNMATVTGVTGLPAGLVNTCLPAGCVYPGGTSDCMIIGGTPSVTGSFTVVVAVDINVTAFGLTQDIPQTIEYTLETNDTATGGCNIIAVASAGNETVAGANDGSASVVANNGTTPYTYAWSNGESTMAISGLAPGTYSVTVTDAAACVVIESATVMTGTTGINTVSASEFEVYPVTPNPSSSKAEIRFSVPDYRDVSVSVHNMIGAVVVSRRIYAEKGLNIVSLNAEKLNPGVYFVTLTDGVSTSTKRMVVGSR